MGCSPLPMRLVATGHAVAHGLAAALEPVGLELRQYRVLAAVGEYAGCRQRSLTDRLHIPPSRVVAVLDTLEARGLVERVQSPTDRRAHAVAATAAGIDLLAQARSLLEAYEGRLLAGLDPAGRSALADLLDRLDASC